MSLTPWSLKINSNYGILVGRPRRPIRTPVSRNLIGRFVLTWSWVVFMPEHCHYFSVLFHFQKKADYCRNNEIMNFTFLKIVMLFFIPENNRSYKISYSLEEKVFFLHMVVLLWDIGKFLLTKRKDFLCTKGTL